MIARVWHGWTTEDNADAYESLLRDTVFPRIQAKGVAGLEGMDVLRRAAGSEVEFVTILWFDALAAVKAFAGEDYEASWVPPEARAVLARFDQRALHFEVRHRLGGAASPSDRG